MTAETMPGGAPVDAPVGLRWDDQIWFPCQCPRCGWRGMSNETAGGNAIADTGDHTDPVCPVCIAPEGDYAHGEWVPVEEIPEPNDKGDSQSPAKKL